MNFSVFHALLPVDVVACEGSVLKPFKAYSQDTHVISPRNLTWGRIPVKEEGNIAGSPVSAVSWVGGCVLFPPEMPWS